MEKESDDRDRAQRIARSVLNRRIGVIDAARSLLSILRRNPEMVTKEDFNFVIAIESETDDLPLGRVRELWNPEVLPEKDRSSISPALVANTMSRRGSAAAVLSFGPVVRRTLRIE
jgi:hypothetical protein